MTAPTFETEAVPPGEWGSIGSGTSHDHARLFVAKPWDYFANSLMQGEVAERATGPGGYAMTVAGAVAHSLFTEPMTSVSDLLQIGLVRRDGCVIRHRQTTYSYGTEEQTERSTPDDLCTSAAMLRTRAEQLGMNSSSARA